MRTAAVVEALILASLLEVCRRQSSRMKFGLLFQNYLEWYQGLLPSVSVMLSQPFARKSVWMCLEWDHTPDAFEDLFSFLAAMTYIERYHCIVSRISRLLPI